MTKITLTLLLLWGSYNLPGQSVISGKVTDEAEKPVGQVSVSYTRLNQKTISGFTRTGEDGSFKLTVRVADADSVTLVFNHMSYARKTVNVPVKTADYTFTLEVEAREFEAVKIMQKPVTVHNDTISYNVKAFTSQQDRVIGDIIQKLPGVEVIGGMIHYQGKPIQKYTVNNLDLMEGRYGIINNNLPADAVKNVQIVENNQPIKILDSLVFSDRASLNLELKKFTSTGTGRVGTGASPALWLANLTPMTFGKSFQMLNSFQTNNIGLDVAGSLRPFYTGGSFFGAGPSLSAAPSYISVRNVSSPGFDQRRWLNNKIFLASSNFLKKLNSGLEIKGNASYYDDTQKRKGVTSTQYFTSEQVIHNTEVIDNSYRINALDAGLLLVKNEKSVFFRNTLRFNKRWNQDIGHLVFNTSTPIHQRRNYTDMTLMNHLSAARFIGKQLVNINSTLEYHHTPQRLWVSPGQFEALLNNGQPADEMQQHVLFKSLKWENSTSFTRRIKNWRMTPQIGLNYHNNRLDSYIEVDQNPLKGELYTNETRSSVVESYVNLSLGWENKSWKFSGQAPVSLNFYKTGNNEVRTTVKPGGTLTYIPDSKSELSLNISGGNSFGGLNNFYNGYIISQYRNIQRYEARLLETRNRNASLSYRFKNPLKASFSNISYTYGRSVRDYIFNTLLDSLGRNTTQINDRNSGSTSHRVTGSTSSFISGIKTVVKLNASTGWTATDYLLNNITGKLHNFSYNTGLEVINTYFSKFSADYKITLSQSANRMAGGRTTQLTFNNHFLNLNWYPVANHSLSLNNSYYRNNIAGQQNQYFADATYRFTFKKWKTDLELTAFNLLNNHRYVQQFSTTYELIQSHFDLRPRQFFISTSFRF